MISATPDHRPFPQQDQLVESLKALDPRRADPISR
jgi:hypothetical protein